MKNIRKKILAIILSASSVASFFSFANLSPLIEPDISNTNNTSIFFSSDSSSTFGIVSKSNFISALFNSVHLADLSIFHDPG